MAPVQEQTLSTTALNQLSSHWHKYLIIPFAIFGAISLLGLIGLAIWYFLKRCSGRKANHSPVIAPARKVGGSRKKDKRFRMKEKEKLRKQKEKRRPPPLQFGFINVRPEHLPLIFSNPTAHSPISCNGCSSSNPNSPKSPGPSSQSTSSSPTVPSPKLPRDIIREMSNPSRLGFIQVDESTLRSPSLAECSTPTSPYASSFGTPSSEYFVAVMPKETAEEEMATVMGDEKAKAPETGPEAMGEREEGWEPKEGDDSESEWEEGEEGEMSMSESGSWDFKCRGEVQGNDEEFNEDWSYKIPEECKPAIESDAEAQGGSLPDSVVQIPSLSPTSLIGETGQIAGLYGSLPRGMGEEGKGGESEINEGDAFEPCNEGRHVENDVETTTAPSGQDLMTEIACDSQSNKDYNLRESTSTKDMSTRNDCSLSSTSEAKRSIVSTPDCDSSILRHGIPALSCPASSGPGLSVSELVQNEKSTQSSPIKFKNICPRPSPCPPRSSVNATLDTSSQSVEVSLIGNKKTDDIEAGLANLVGLNDQPAKPRWISILNMDKKNLNLTNNTNCDLEANLGGTCSGPQRTSSKRASIMLNASRAVFGNLTNVNLTRKLSVKIDRRRELARNDLERGLSNEM